jgi:8-oxo-dGTP pyrophosphatase MutT (NUDIX family)
MPERTWDGLLVAREPPYGAAVLVWRRRPVPGDGAAEVEFLILHRGHLGVGFEGDWAWGPPAGARVPGERVDECARRELFEETGLTCACVHTDLGSADWAVYLAEHRGDADIVLSHEHDRFVWISAEMAERMCLPAFVGEPVIRAAALLRGDG